MKTPSNDGEGAGISPVNDDAHHAREHLVAPKADSMVFYRTMIERFDLLTDVSSQPAKIGPLMDATRFFHMAGLPSRGIGAAQRIVAIASDSGDAPNLRKGLTWLGVMFAEIGNLPLASDNFSRAFQIAAQQGDRCGELAVRINVGATLLMWAQYGEALTLFEQVAAACEQNSGEQRLRNTALGYMALAAFYLEDYRASLRWLEESEGTPGEPVDAFGCMLGALRAQHYTCTFLALDNLRDARRHSRDARVFADRSNTARAQIAALVAEGLYDVHAGMVDPGLSRLARALEHSRLVRATLHDSLFAVARAHEIAGHPDRALVYLGELIDKTRKAAQDYAQNRERFAESKLVDFDLGSDHQAITPLERRETALKGRLAEQELLRSRQEMLERLAVAAELRDDSTGEHSYRVGKLAALIAQDYGCDEDMIFMLDLAGRLHDIGKIGVPDAILLKSGRLNETELHIMRAHTIVGAELLAKSNMPQMQMAEDIARCHHEWWDGTGYPSQLSGTAIPIAARITALADVFDALTHKRPYKDAWPVEAALAEIASLRGRQFDPDLCDLFLALVPRLCRSKGDLDSFLGQAARESSFLQSRSKIWMALSQRRHMHVVSGVANHVSDLGCDTSRSSG